MELKDIRKKLDKIDGGIMKLLAKRQSYMPLVAAYKKAHGMPLTQPQREKEILIEKVRQSKELGLDAKLIEKMFKMIFVSSKQAQKRHLESIAKKKS